MIAHVNTDVHGDVGAPGATQAVTMPSGATSSQIAILAISSGRSGTNTPGTWAGPSGWTQIGSQISATRGSPGAAGAAIAAYWSLGNNANLTFTKSGTVDFLGYVCATFSGVNLTAPIDVTGTGDSNSSATSLTISAITIATNNAWDIIVASDNSNGNESATNFTASLNANTQQNCAILYNTTPKPVGTTGTATLNDDAAGTSQILTALRFALVPIGYGPAFGRTGGMNAILAMRHRQPGHELPTRKWWRTEGGILCPERKIHVAHASEMQGNVGSAPCCAA